MTQAFTSRHKRAAWLWLAAAIVSVLLSLAALLHAVASDSASQWPAVAWQLLQLVALVCLGLALWQAKQHRDARVRQQGLEHGEDGR